MKPSNPVGALIVALSLMTAACSHLPRVTLPVNAPQVATDPPPDGESEALYRLLLGEIAGQRDQLEVAVENYLAAALASTDARVAQRATQIALYARNQDAALRAAQRWQALDPQNVDASQALAMLYLRAGDADNTVAQLRQLLAKVEGEPNAAFMQIALLLGKEGEKSIALQVMQQLVDGYPELAFAHYSHSQLALHLEDTDTALRAVQRALELNPGWSEAHVLRARVQTQAGDEAGALAGLRQFLQKHPNDRVVRLNYARQLLQAQQVDSARSEFRRLLKGTPNDPDVLFAMALLSLDANETKQAEAFFQRLVKLDKRTDEAHYYLGRIAESRRHYIKATGWYEKVRQGEYVFEAQVRIADMLAHQGHLELSRSRLRTLQQRFPDQAVRLYLAEGEILTRAQQLELAMQVYDEALGKHADNADLLYARALLNEKLDRLGDTERDLRSILSRDPDNAMALNALGYTLADRTTRYQEARELIVRALQLQPQDAAILDSMGWVEYRLGDLAAARQYLEQAYARNQDAEIASHLAEVLAAGGDVKAARTLLEAAIKNHPEDTRLRDQLRGLKP